MRNLFGKIYQYRAETLQQVCGFGWYQDSGINKFKELV
jgi:hypothetical protein